MGGLTSLQRSSRYILQPQPTGQQSVNGRQYIYIYIYIYIYTYIYILQFLIFIFCYGVFMLRILKDPPHNISILIQDYKAEADLYIT